MRAYYQALAARDYRAAWALWRGEGEASGQSYEQFARGFERTATTAVEITGPAPIEGAAGSSYAAVPVRVHATTTSGERQEYAGTYTLRRVNDVPGATAAQLRWHIESARLKALP